MYNNKLYKSGKENFRYLIASAGLSRFSLSAYNLVIIWSVLFITKKPVLAGLSDSMMSVPLFLSFIVGAYVDRAWNKKAIAMAAGMLRFLLAVLIIFSVLSRLETFILVTICVSTFLIGFTSDVQDAARASWTKAFLDENTYKKGVSQLSSVTMVAQAAGFIASGFIIASGLPGAFSLIASLFMLSAIPIIAIRHEKYGGSGRINNYIREGLSISWNDKRIREMIVLILIANIIIGMAAIMFISLVQIVLKLSSVYLSVIFGTFVTGMAAGSMIGYKLSGKLGRISLTVYTEIGISLASIYFMHSIFIIMIPAATAGLGMGIASVSTQTAILKAVPENLMARIQGSMNSFGVAASSVSSVIGGFVFQFASMYSFIALGFLMGFVDILVILFRDFSRMEY